MARSHAEQKHTKAVYGPSISRRLYFPMFCRQARPCPRRTSNFGKSHLMPRSTFADKDGKSSRKGIANIPPEKSKGLIGRKKASPVERRLRPLSWQGKQG